MRHKCDGCFYKTDWAGTVESFPICERLWYESFDEAKDECAKPGPCDFYISDEEALKIIDRFNEIQI